MVMVYKLNKRVQRRRSPKTLLIAGCGLLLVSSMATVYADFPNSPGFANHNSKKQPHAITASSGSDVKKNLTGSAHKSTGVSSPNSAIPKLSNLKTNTCTMFPPKNPDLSQALSPELRKMAQYEQVCNGKLFERASFFTGTPTTVADAQVSAHDVAVKLKEYAQFGIQPLVFMEPTNNSGTISLSQDASGAYDSALRAYYAALRQEGIDDTSMGMWVILPEGNLPEWGSVDPTIFAQVVTKTVHFQKQYFPASLASVMLDSETYPTATSYDGGQYVSLLPYVQSIPSGLIDSFGLQGFPWVGPSDTNESYEPAVYLRVDLAMQAARSLGTSRLWFNTGTFSQMYANQPGRTVSVSPLQRQQMLSATLAQLNKAQTQGFKVSLHLFAENKAGTAEGTDWSYWAVQPGNDAGTAVFTEFVHDATADNVPLWLFDSMD